MAAWWINQDRDREPNPLFTLRLFGLRGRRWDLGLTLLVLLGLAVSRWAAFPASIWEQDEAYFATAVLHLDPTANHPHPPWFPLWIAAGKLVHRVVNDPARALQLVSAVLSVWLVFPLGSLWSLLVRRELAVAAAVMACMVPGPWLLSGRAFSGTAATALVALAFALWFGYRQGTPRSTRHLLLGSTAAGLAVLTRPHFLVAVLPLAVLVASRHGGRRDRWAIAIPLFALMLGATVWLSWTAGGVAPLAGALREHAAIHFAQLAHSSSTLAETGLARALLYPLAAAAWVLASLIGLASAVGARRTTPALLPLLLCVLLPIALLVVGASNPGHPRYWVPIIAFSSGFVVVAAARLLGRRWWLVPVAVVVASCVRVVPALPDYRRVSSPPVRAMEAAFREARSRGSVVVVDRTLVAFADLERARRPFYGTVLLDSQIAGGETVAPPPWATVFVHDRGHGHQLRPGGDTRVFEVAQPVLEALSQGRFLEVAVVVGADLAPAAAGGAEGASSPRFGSGTMSRRR